MSKHSDKSHFDALAILSLDTFMPIKASRNEVNRIEKERECTCVTHVVWGGLNLFRKSCCWDKARARNKNHQISRCDSLVLIRLWLGE